MSLGTIKPPRRTRSTVECELMAAHGRIKTLRMSPEFMDDDSTARRVHDWYSTRAGSLERELESMTRPGA